MVIGVFYISFRAIWGVIMLILWLISPILPIILVVIFITGWTPKIIPKIREDFKNWQKNTPTKEIKPTKGKRSLLL